MRYKTCVALIFGLTLFTRAAAAQERHPRAREVHQEVREVFDSSLAAMKEMQRRWSSRFSGKFPLADLAWVLAGFRSQVADVEKNDKDLESEFASLQKGDITEDE